MVHVQNQSGAGLYILFIAANSNPTGILTKVSLLQAAGCAWGFRLFYCWLDCVLLLHTAFKYFY